MTDLINEGDTVWDLHEALFAHNDWTDLRPSPPTRPVQYTLRMSYEESDALDALTHALRKRRGRSTANSDVLRGLVVLATNDPGLQQRLGVFLASTAADQRQCR